MRSARPADATAFCAPRRPCPVAVPPGRVRPARPARILLTVEAFLQSLHVVIHCGTSFLVATIGMSKTLICSQRHTIYRCCNNLQFNILFHNFVKLAFCSSLVATTHTITRYTKLLLFEKIFVAHYLKIHIRRQSLFGSFCAERRSIFLQLFAASITKKYLLFCNNRYFLELMARFEPATY